MSAILASARASEIDWAAPDCVKWFLYNFADAATILVPEWQTRSLKRGLRGDNQSGVFHAKVVSRYANEFHGAGISRELAKVVRNCYKADGINLGVVPSL